MSPHIWSVATLTYIAHICQILRDHVSLLQTIIVCFHPQNLFHPLKIAIFMLLGSDSITTINESRCAIKRREHIKIFFSVESWLVRLQIYSAMTIFMLVASTRDEQLKYLWWTQPYNVGGCCQKRSLLIRQIKAVFCGQSVSIMSRESMTIKSTDASLSSDPFRSARFLLSRLPEHGN